MHLKSDYHLTYCTNIHSGESWEEVFVSIQKYVLPIKEKLSPDAPFGIGLRLSDNASRTLVGNEELTLFKKWLDRHQLYVFTINGFPFGGFHNTVVKDAVHKPDWLSNERIEYTLRLCKILAGLLPEGMDGGISTSPLSYKPWYIEDTSVLPEIFRKGCKNFLRVIEELHQIKLNTGKTIHLDLEPEPDGLIENTEETLAFFEEYLIPEGIKYFQKEGINKTEAEGIIKRHFQVCYDVCHFAVAYEEPLEVFNRFEAAGIKIGKIQISAALKADLTKGKETIVHELSPFIESTYLHQVIARTDDNKLVRYNDLPPAIDNIYKVDAKEWRTHFHVPIFSDGFKQLQSTQDEIIKVLEILKNKHVTNHLEIETYTWEVLPSELKISLQHSIEREMEWVMEKISSGNI